MTELQGPSTLCVPQDGWEGLPLEERAPLTARQGVRFRWWRATGGRSQDAQAGAA